MNLLRYLCACLCALLIVRSAQAANFTGGQITYSWLHDSTYKFYLKMYGPCDASAQAPSSASLCYFNSCNAQSGSITLQFDSSPIVHPPRYKEYLYEGSFALPSRCNYWTFYTTLVARDSAVNLVNGSNNIYIEATLNNQVPDTLSSPFYIGQIFPFYIAGMPSVVSYYVADPNNDSLAVEIINPRTAAGCQAGYTATDIPFIAGCSTNAPFAATNISFNYGLLSFTPQASGRGNNVLVMRVNKYHNGQKKGSVMCDAALHFVLKDTTTIRDSIDFVPGTVSGCAITGTTPSVSLQAAVNTPMYFCRYVQRTHAHLHMYDDHVTSCPGAQTSYTGMWSDSAVICFSWTPGAGDTGMHVLSVTAGDVALATCDDSNMHPIFTEDFLVNIYVSPYPLSVQTATASPANVTVYPNPATAMVHISAPVKTDVAVYNTIGQAVLHTSGKNELDISSLAGGVYMLRISDEAGRLLKVERITKTGNR